MRSTTSVVIAIVTWLLIASLAGAQGPAPPPIEVWFANPRVEDVRISPGGEYLSMIAHQTSREVIVIRNLETDESVPIMSFKDPKIRLRDVMWVSPDRLLLHISYVVDQVSGAGNRASRLFSVRADGKELQRLGADWPVQEFVWQETDIVSILFDDPKHVLVQLRLDDEGPAVYRMDVNKGRIKQVVAAMPGIDRWMADLDGVVRAGWGEQNGRQRVVARATEDGDWKLIHDSARPDSTYRCEVVGFDFDGRTIYLASNLASDRMEIFRFDLLAGEHGSFGEKVFGNDLVDVAGPLNGSRVRRKAQAIRYVVDEDELYFLDPGTAKEWGGIDRALPGKDHAVVSGTSDETKVVLKSSGARTPPIYHLLDREKRKLKVLYSEHPDIKEKDTVPISAFRFEARDGIEIPAYLAVPADVERKNLPLIVLPHVGPTGRDQRAWDPRVQYIASRGYATLLINYRGSTGYGRDFEVAGHQQWGRAMQDDLTDGVRFLIGKGVVDPQRVCILGAEYAGYAAAMALVREPELFKCAASLAGMMDLVDIRSDDRWYYSMGAPVFAEGTPESNRKAVSPLFNVDKIQGAILLAHGENDQRVPVRHAKEMAAALEAAGKPHRLVVFGQETHGFGEAARAVQYYRMITDFIEANIGEGVPARSAP